MRTRGIEFWNPTVCSETRKSEASFSVNNGAPAIRHECVAGLSAQNHSNPTFLLDAAKPSSVCGKGQGAQRDCEGKKPRMQRRQPAPKRKNLGGAEAGFKPKTGYSL